MADPGPVVRCINGRCGAGLRIEPPKARDRAGTLGGAAGVDAAGFKGESFVTTK